MAPRPVLAQRATFTTTTVFITGPTGTSVAPSGPVQVPIGAIVGGLSGGIFLALVLVGGWIWWGKAIERKARKQPRLRSAMKRDPYREGKRTGTSSDASMRGSGRSLPRTHPMAMAAASQKSVTFAEEPTDEAKPGTPSPAGSTRNSEEKERPRFHRTSDDRTRRVDERTSDDRERGREGSTPPPAARGKFRPPLPRTPSAERAYAPARPSPLAKEALSRAPTAGGTTSPQPSTRGGAGSRPPTPGGTAPAPLSRSPTPTNPAQAGLSTNANKAVTQPPPPARLWATQDSNPPHARTQDGSSFHSHTQDTSSLHTPRSAQPPPVPPSRVPPALTPDRLSDFPAPSPAAPVGVSATATGMPGGAGRKGKGRFIEG
ncbi:hypothetical protein BU17DRAFT_67235 [Hysterangium stoloniferum]|nr:hypothetical protein BU17DRAFT_67235 [Hysterangium stoloniferum]